MSEEAHSSPSEAGRKFGRETPASITGVGAVTGFGWGRKHTWDGFLLGDSAVKLTDGFDGFVDGGSAYVSAIAPGGDRRDGPSRFMQAVRFAAARPSPMPWSAGGSRDRRSGSSTASSSATRSCGATTTGPGSRRCPGSGSR